MRNNQADDRSNDKQKDLNSPPGARPAHARGSAAPGGPGLVNGVISRQKQAHGHIFGTVIANQNGLKAKRESTRPPYGKTFPSKRKEIRGFSASSRRRMTDYLLTLNWEILKAESKKAKYARGIFATLTYPDGYSHDWKNWKRHLDNFRKHLIRDYGESVSVIWKLENQESRCLKTGAEFIPHFHLAIDLKEPTHLGSFRRWLSIIWYVVVNSQNPAHLSAGTNAICIYGETGKLLSYLCKYLSKTYESKVETGRVWGVWNKFEEAPFKTYTGVAWVKLLRKVRLHGKKSRYLRSLNALKTNGFRMFGENLEQLLEREGNHE